MAGIIINREVIDHYLDQSKKVETDLLYARYSKHYNCVLFLQQVLQLILVILKKSAKVLDPDNTGIILTKAFTTLVLTMSFVGCCHELSTIVRQPRADYYNSYHSDKKANFRAVEEVRSGKKELADAAWWGFDGQNATEALQGAINSGAEKVLVPNMGRPWQVDTIFLKSNQEIIFKKGVVIYARKGSFMGKRDCLFSAQNKNNIILSGYGAVLEMRKEDYSKPPYTKAEWRHGISLRGCRDVRIQGITIRNSGGDGIYIGRGFEGQIFCEDIIIKDVVLDGHYRQGISVISVKNLIIENSIISNTGGTFPQAGIDFEPNHSDEKLVNCRVKNSDIKGNRGPGILVNLKNLDSISLPVSIKVSSSVIRNNMVALWIIGMRGKPRGQIHFQGNQICGIKYARKSPELEVLFAQ